MQKLAKKFVEVMRECSHVVKTGTNDFHRYKYATANDVLEKVNGSLTRHGIASVVTPALLSVQDITTAKGNTERLATVEVTVTLIDSESGESFAIKGLGSGQDAGDKSLAKAQTMALKYAYLASLAIATGDDPEADMHTDDVMHPKIAQVKNNSANPLICHDCNSPISQKVADYSKSKFGRFLCLDCQRVQKSVA
ncbi:MAG: ERF family protein [Selenomonadaceae bacterium]|nr:ERF family protein [Selenomonadaceae bacterium]